MHDDRYNDVPTRFHTSRNRQSTKHFLHAAEIIGMKASHRHILMGAKNELVVEFPDRMDDDTHRIFRAFRIQHNNILGVAVDPKELSCGELERVVRRFIHALGANIGLEYDIPAPDVGTDAR